MARIPLVIDGKRLRTLEELRETFNLGELIERFHGGQLRAWLHCWEFETELEQLEALPSDLPEAELAEALCRIFGIEGKAKEKAFLALEFYKEWQQISQDWEQAKQEIEQSMKDGAALDAEASRMAQMGIDLVANFEKSGKLPSEEELRDFEAQCQKSHIANKNLIAKLERRGLPPLPDIEEIL